MDCLQAYGWLRPDNGGFTSNHTVKHKSPPDRKVAQVQPPATKARYRSVFDPGCNYPVPRSLRMRNLIFNITSYISTPVRYPFCREYGTSATNRKNMTTKIAFFGAKPYDRESFDQANEAFGFDIRYYKGHLTEESAVLAKGAAAACIFVNDTADAAAIRALKEQGVPLIALRCAGFNNVDLDAAARNGIAVVRVPAYSPYAVAEHAVALMLALNRKIHRAYWRTRDGNFSLHGLMGFDMHGKTAGIVGTGKIARILIRILRGFGMEVLGYDLYPDERFAREAGMTYVPLDELYERSDIVSLHCPLTEQTRYMIDEESIGRMKPGVILINTGRGQLIRTNALIEGLKEKRIGAAGLDVYEEEGEYFYEDKSDKIIDDDTLARLLSFNNVIVTSHQGFFTREALANIAETTLANIRDFTDGKTLANEVKGSK